MSAEIKHLVIGIATLITIIINLVVDLIPLNGITTAKISDSFPIFFVPSGYVFAIWGLIYIGLIAIVLYFVGIEKAEKKKVLGLIFVPHLIGLIANSAWIIIWHYQIFSLTVAIILVLLLSLTAIVYKLDHLKEMEKDKGYLWQVKYPFSIYLGWVSVATIANISQYLYSVGLQTLLLSGQVWASILMITAALLGVIRMAFYKDLAFNLVIIWALIGIMVKFQSEQVMFYAGGFAIALIVTATICKNLVWKK